MTLQPKKTMTNEIENFLKDKNYGPAKRLIDVYQSIYPEEPYGWLLKAHTAREVDPEQNHAAETEEIIRNGIYYAYKSEETKHLAGLFNELGILYKLGLKTRDAINFYSMAIDYLSPSHNDVSSLVHFNLATALLTYGDFARGWEYYKYLYIGRETYIRNFPQPFWDGSRMDGKVIYLHNEQAYGDLMFFFRFVRNLMHSNSGFRQIILEIPKNLIRLFYSCPFLRTSPDGPIDDRILLYPRIEGSDVGIDFDVHTTYALLPGIFKIVEKTIPREDIIPYLTPEDELVARWRQRVQELEPDPTRLKVAINYRGKPTNVEELNRQVPLSKFLILKEGELAERVTLFSIQKFHGLEELKDEYPIINIGKELDLHGDSYVDTLALFESMDLLITSDTSLAHLVGILGKPVWVLLQYSAEWRWQNDRTDSPWYLPNMKLFRQTKYGDWDTVMPKVQRELCDLHANCGRVLRQNEV